MQSHLRMGSRCEGKECEEYVPQFHREVVLVGMDIRGYTARRATLLPDGDSKRIVEAREFSNGRNIARGARGKNVNATVA
jgi:hypothetical protein